MAYSRSFLDELKARLLVSSVVGRRVKLTRRGREFVGLSPFKSERTPSFTVNDDKQFYHCFSTGKHGSIFDFLIETEGVSFPEAVERLADMAGLQVPAPDPRARARAVQAKSLIEVVSLAVKWFQVQLRGPGGRVARDYLAGRGVSPELIENFLIGYAPDSRTGLINHLADAGVSADKISAAGLSITPDDDAGSDRRPPYDRFRDRVMFPIQDLRGRVIAFGGRALRSDVSAKYLNSPESPLFHKGRILYNIAQARQPSYDAKQLLVVEGYMDVIGLARADIAHCVAPLGTAMTPEQIALLWRITPEPILCMDGDEAGLRAAYRVVERALPLLRPGYSLNFALLPEGKDPDDLINEGQVGAFKKLLATPHSLVDILWMRETRTVTYKTPEQKAALEQSLKAMIELITNKSIYKHYKSEIDKRLFDFFRQPRLVAQNSRLVEQEDIAPSRSALQSSAVTGVVSFPRQEALIVLGVIRYPQLLKAHLEKFACLTLDPMLSKLRFEITDFVEDYQIDKDLDTTALRVYLESRDRGEMIAQIEKRLKSESFIFIQDFSTENIEDASDDDTYRDHLVQCETDWLEVLRVQTYMVLKRELNEIRREYARTGDPKYSDLLCALARKIIEIQDGDDSFDPDESAHPTIEEDAEHNVS